MTLEIIGWASSIILLLTLIKQVYKQWKDGETEGVSKWLFIGQLFASADLRSTAIWSETGFLP